MAAPQLVIQIQAIVRSPSSYPQDHVKKIASDYAESCATANKRLLQSTLYLKQGFRFEALRRIQEKPALVGEVDALLRFPEREQWIKLSHEVGIPVPRIDFQLAEELNELFETPDLQRKLAAEFRILNLQRSPLPQRIAKLKEMCAADPSNTLWRRCLESHSV